MLGENKMTHEQVEQQMVTMMLYNIQTIYQNHSTDEYKMAGDITKSPEYNSIEKMITDLHTLKGYPQSEANDISTMFSTLHKPIFKETVREFIIEPNDKNALYTAMFTVGYRVLVGELSRIYASTTATDKGLVYVPDKISRRNDVAPFIKSYNEKLNQRIDDYIKSKHDGVKRYKESFMLVNESTIDYLKATEQMYQEDGLLSSIGNVLNTITNGIFKGIGWVFKGFKEVNPVSFMNACLMHSYQKKVDNFHNTAAMYEETKKAYDQYMKLPASKRSAKVEEKYRRNIERYNLAMENQKAKIADYDQRAQDERDRQESEFPKVDPNSGPNPPKVPDMYDNEDTSNLPQDHPSSTPSSTPSPAPQPQPADDDFGF